jgi:hypothetical protein
VCVQASILVEEIRQRVFHTSSQTGPDGHRNLGKVGQAVLPSTCHVQIIVPHLQPMRLLSTKPLMALPPPPSQTIGIFFNHLPLSGQLPFLFFF